MNSVGTHPNVSLGKRRSLPGGFGSYGPGCLWHPCLLHAPRKPDKGFPTPSEQQFPKPLTKGGEPSKIHRPKNAGTRGLIGFRLIRTWGSTGPFAGLFPQ